MKPARGVDRSVWNVQNDNSKRLAPQRGTKPPKQRTSVNGPTRPPDVPEQEHEARLSEQSFDSAARPQSGDVVDDHDHHQMYRYGL